MSKAVAVGVVAGVAAMVAGVLFVLTRPATKRSTEPSAGGAGAGAPGAGAGAAAGDAPPLTKQQMISIFGRITEMMRLVVAELSEQEAAIRQNAAAQGQTITDDEMMQFFMGRFRQQMAEVEQAVYREHQTNDEAVRAATKFYEGDEEFAKTLAQLKDVFQKVTGQTPAAEVEIPEGVTKEVVLAMMQDTMVGVNVVLEAIHAELVKAGLSPQSPEYKQLLQKGYMERVAGLRDAVQQKYGLGEVRCSCLALLVCCLSVCLYVAC